MLIVGFEIAPLMREVPSGGGAPRSFPPPASPPLPSRSRSAAAAPPVPSRTYRRSEGSRPPATLRSPSLPARPFAFVPFRFLFPRARSGRGCPAPPGWGGRDRARRLGLHRTAPSGTRSAIRCCAACPGRRAAARRQGRVCWKREPSGLFPCAFGCSNNKILQ